MNESEPGVPPAGQNKFKAMAHRNDAASSVLSGKNYAISNPFSKTYDPDIRDFYIQFIYRVNFSKAII
jgi:hypothetical protein